MDEKIIQHEYVMEYLSRQEKQGGLGYRNESNIVVSNDLFIPSITFEVYLNYELEQQLLSFGEKVKVLEPGELKERIKERLTGAMKNYEE